MTRVVVPIANGVEEIEAVCVIDTLRRAEWEVTVAGIEEGPVTASRGVRLLADEPLANLSKADYGMLAIPGGGGGVERLMGSELLREWICDFMREDKYVAAICAGPRVLFEAGVLSGRRFTCYPGAEKTMPGTERSTEKVVVDGHLVTSQGAGTAISFALALIALLDGEQKATRVAEAMIAKYP